MKALLIALFMLMPMVAFGQQVKGIPPLYEGDDMPTCNADREGLRVRVNATSATSCNAAGSTVHICECIGTVWTDADVEQTAPFTATTLASGDLTLNAINLATAADTYDIPDGACNAAADIGTWVTIVVRDASEVVIISSADASNVFNVPLLSLDAGDVLDMVTNTDSEGAHITLVCLAADQWYSTSLHYLASGAIGWADGGAS